MACKWKNPVAPSYGEQYWSVAYSKYTETNHDWYRAENDTEKYKRCKDGIEPQCLTWGGNTRDLSSFALGNCFRDKKEAEKFKLIIMKRLVVNYLNAKGERF